MAIQLARLATGRFKTISLGTLSMAALSTPFPSGGESFFRSGIGPLLPGTEHVPPPDPVGCPFRCGDRCNLACADYVEYVLAKEGDVSAVLGESMRSTGVVPPPDYWQRIRAACDRHGALLILDEIPNGLGRSGSMFTCQQYGVVPDILVIGKGLGGGVFPLAAILAREELNVAGKSHRTLYSRKESGCLCRGPGCYPGYRRRTSCRTRTAARRHGTRILSRVARAVSHHQGSSRAWVSSSPWFSWSQARRELRPRAKQRKSCTLLFDSGLNFKVSMGNILTLTPPLTIREDELREALDILASAFEEVVGGQKSASSLMIIEQSQATYDVAIVGGGILGWHTLITPQVEDYESRCSKGRLEAQGASTRNFGLIWPIGQSAANYSSGHAQSI